jgi:SAM-dependent methyltransferase
LTVGKARCHLGYGASPGRPPKSDQVVHNHRKAPGLRSLYQGFRRLAALRARPKANAGGARQAAPLPVFTPPLKVDTSADADALRQLWQSVRLAWESLGDERPFHSVLTEPQYLPDRVGETEAQFWESGRAEAEQLAHYLGSIGFASCKDLTVIEYGCGVGRVTVPLAAIAKEVVGYDISEPHLQLARQRALALGRTNIRLIALGDLPAAFEPCDAFYSKIVLQHNPPPLIGYLLRTLIRSLRRGGVGVFQVPTYYAGYRFDLHSALQSPQHSDMEMHCYPQADLFSLFADEGARLVHAREDDTPGRRDIFVSQVFVLMK